MSLELPHGTTIVALTCVDGIVMAGGRQLGAGDREVPLGLQHGAGD